MDGYGDCGDGGEGCLTAVVAAEHCCESGSEFFPSRIQDPPQRIYVY
jgi:hypothetical protein